MLKHAERALLVDQHTDTSQAVLYKAAAALQNEDLTEALKATADDAGDLDKLASEAFAWPEERLFPVDCLDNVVRSKVYFDYQRGLIKEATAARIQDRLATYLDLYDVPEELFAKRPLEKTAADAVPVYLLPAAKLCKVAAKEDLARAAALFEREAGNLALADRVEFARNFVKVAAEYKVTDAFGPAIATYASALDSDLANTRAMLHLRKAAADRAGQDGSAYEKLAQALSDVEGAASREELTKLAQTIQALDETCGLDEPAYDRRLPDAYQAVFNKTAVDEECEAKDGDDAKRLKEMTKADIVARFGEGALEEVERQDGTIDLERLKKVKDLAAGMSAAVDHA